MVTPVSEAAIIGLLKSQLCNFFTLGRDEEILIDVNWGGGGIKKT